MLMTFLLPLQIAAYSGNHMRPNHFFLVSSFVDTARILGLPKFRLRDSNGNPYLPDKVLTQEPLAMIYASADIVFSPAANAQRKQYILSYVRR